MKETAYWRCVPCVVDVPFGSSHSCKPSALEEEIAEIVAAQPPKRGRLGTAVAYAPWESPKE